MRDASQVQEPCFQSKKRLEGPATSLSASDFSNSNEVKKEYILLGRNNKFEDNIQYKWRTLKNINTETDDNENNSTEMSLPENSEAAVNDYILLGNNSKLSNNIVYKPRRCPEAVNDEKKENAWMQEEPRPVLSNLSEDYMLLGSNAKFSDNIVYKPKIWYESIPSNGKENEPAEDTEDFRVQDKKLEPAPVVDTSKFREPPKKLKKPVEKTDDDSELKIKKKKTSPVIQGGLREDLRLPLDDLHSGREAIDVKAAFKDKNGGAPNGQDALGEKTIKFQSPPAAPRSPKPTNKKQDNDQRLLALLHKAGIRLPARSVAEQSEYQKNFTWKNPMPNSSVAENKKQFETTNTFINPLVSRQHSVPKITEYQRNFQAWVPLPTKPASPSTTVEKTIVQSDHNLQKEPKRPATKSSKNKKTVHTESCSSPLINYLVNKTDQGQGLDIGPVASGICSDEDADNIQQENNMKSTKRLESPCNQTATTPTTKTPKHKCCKSGYREDFKAPYKYSYMTNTWDSADSLNEDPQSDQSGKGDWYSEVCDLRRKAAEYRQRANNTHFCAAHVGQLLSSETQLWEKNNSDKLSIEQVDVSKMRPAGITYNKYYRQRPVVTRNEQSTYDSNPEPQMIVEDVIDDDDDDVAASDHSEPQVDANCVPTSLETNIVPAPSAEENNGEASPQTAEDPEGSSGLFNGRIPSPELLQQNMKRHHLDRTTPTKGGYLLISPSRSRKKMGSERSNSPYTAEPVSSIESPYSSSSTTDAEGKPKHCVKTCALPSKSPCQLTAGKPSKDTHILRAQENLQSSTKPLPKESLVQPSQRMSQDTSNVTLRSGGNRRPKKSETKQHPAGIKSKAATYTMPSERVYPAKHKTNDFLSESLESNSSLASEILERTRKRLDFW